LASFAGGGGATTFSALTDTTIANLQTNQVAQWSGSAWVNGYMDMQHISDVDSVDTLQNGDILKYNAPNGQFEFHNLEQEVQGDVDDHLNVSSATANQVLSWDGSDYEWVSNFAYQDSDVNAHLNQSSAGNNQVLSWDGSDYAWVDQSGGGGGGGSQNLFANIAVSGQNTITADSTTDTLTFAAGSGISITTNSTSDTLTIAATGGGGGGSGATVERFKLNYATNGNLDSTSDKTSGINSISIDSTTSGEVSITFTGYNYPPASVMLYGYDYANNKYYASSIETTMATREIAGGGSSGSPTLFDGSATPTIKLRLREAETGASRSFGTATHAWIQMVMYD
jgi:hypothetical protein